MNYILEYWEGIKNGEIVVGRRVRAVYERLAHEITDPEPDSPYYFSEDAGERPILFIENFANNLRVLSAHPSSSSYFKRRLFKLFLDS